jgi:uncharacterized protein YbbK (DUF523 family)
LAEQQKPVLGIGACLDGNPVRYDGSCKAANRHVQAIKQEFELRAFCPEMAAGMGSPRPPIHLVGAHTQVLALDVASHSRDYTDKLAGHARHVLAQAPEICGYILVKDSPSCGYQSVKRFSAEGDLVATDQQGIFAAALQSLDPLLPLEDDERLNEQELRDSFIIRARIFHQWKLLAEDALTPAKLRVFYRPYQQRLISRHQPSDTKLKALLTGKEQSPQKNLSGDFIRILMAGLSPAAD